MNQVHYFIKQLHSFSGRILYVNLLGMALVSILEGIGIFLLIPMLSYSGIVNIDIGGTKFSKYFSFTHDYPKNIFMILILGFYVSLVIIQNIVQRNLLVRNAKITQGFIRQLRLETYNLLLRARWSFYTKERKADLINVMTMELARVAGGIIQFLQLITSLIFTSIQIFIAFYLSVKLTAFVLLSGFILGFFSRGFIRKSKFLGGKTSVLAQEYLAGITDQLNGMKEIKSNTLEESRLNWLNSLTKGMVEEQIEYVNLKYASQTIYKITSASLIAVFIYIYLMIFDAHPAQFLLIFIIFSRLWPRFTDIQSGLEQIASCVPAFRSLIELQIKCKKEIEITDENYYKEIKPLRFEKKLECQNTFFRYNQNEPTYALKNINLEIPINCVTAIVGSSGAGKSTLIDILIGLNKPELGDVLIDGKTLSEENLLSLRRSVSYVPQDPFLFNGSIRDNMLMIEPNSSEIQIWDALEFSAAAEFVGKLPNALDTIVGDRGIRLSGGERQRLVLARAILRKPAILVLDEATSALDMENEAKVQEALERLKGTMTIIVIAHRLSTIRNADQVIVLSQGEVIQQGKYSELASEKKGMFNDLLNKQIKMSV
ncbi:ABC transporter ATP-binding protein [Neobacillus sp. PS3-40]|uniref:ABC transporter ATP-binding protein n=1 Tax=Neobacillus sp. PS3-40 TaxID=3070679 RepID=UPI0027E0CFEA|nr:ABC transporter ATP-binding protein [Neobacillus sp. PS3-40]WML45833.1 ABC transporter ATP-binding protein [Neobacillus sp. PS3-40]